MKRLELLFIFFLIVLTVKTAKTQNSHCTNLSFDLGDFTNWSGYIRRFQTVAQYPNAPIQTTWEKAALPVTASPPSIIWDRIILIENKGQLPPRFKYFAQLGSQNLSGPRAWQQKILYTMSVDSSSSILIVKFSLEFWWRSGHSKEKQPQFSFILFDQNGDTIHDCGNYYSYASDYRLMGRLAPGFPVGWKNDSIKSKNWTTVGIDLKNYYGKTITLEFFTCDDMYEGITHGVANIAAECLSPTKIVSYCSGDSIARIEATEGFKKYEWRDALGNVKGVQPVLQITDPPDQATYSCTMTSETGCVITRKFKIIRGEFTAGFGSFMLDCNSNKVQMQNLTVSKSGELDYKWEFDDSTKTARFQPEHTFATSGLHTVSLTVSKPLTTCITKLTKTVESFSPPLVGIAGNPTFCHGASMTLKGYGAADYTWGDGSKADSLVVKPPGGTFSLIGKSTNGCTSDVIYKTVEEDPDWDFSDRSDTIMCSGNYEAILSVSGAEKYLWNTNERTPSVLVTMPGDYQVTATNSRGCNKTKTITVKEYPLPEEFTIQSSVSKINPQQSSVVMSVAPQPGLSYTWDMGDGATENGTSVSHTYHVTGDIKSYSIKVTAQNEGGCQRSASTHIEVVPFMIPNVFSPNGDGINDIFMPDVELEIFDRNGLVLYRGSTGWDGNFRGRQMAPDTYFYIFHYQDSDEKQQVRKGYVMLVR